MWWWRTSGECTCWSRSRTGRDSGLAAEGAAGEELPAARGRVDENPGTVTGFLGHPGRQRRSAPKFHTCGLARGWAVLRSSGLQMNTMRPRGRYFGMATTVICVLALLGTALGMKAALIETWYIRKLN